MIKGTVTILGEKFQLEEETPDGIKRKAAHLYQERRGNGLPLEMLRAIASLDSNDRKRPGRKPKYSSTKMEKEVPA